MSTREGFTGDGSHRVLAFVILSLLSSSIALHAAEPLDPASIPQFADPLPALQVVSGVDRLELRMTEFRAQVLPSGMPQTWVWGYLTPGETSRSSYIGPVIVAQRGRPLEVTWVNDLGDTAHTNVTAWRDATDQTLHWADPLHGGASACSETTEPGSTPSGECAEHYSGPIPAVPHLHGGAVPAAIDGGPDGWFTSDGAFHGPSFYSRDGAAATNHAILRYPNAQEAAPLWFHDHTLGATRLGVYAGLAGAYLLTDPSDPPPANLPAPIPLVIQDRMFDDAGQLVFPAGVPFIPNPSHPFWVPEFLGDTIVVNGKTWPYLEVEPKRYRFLFVDGSNARGYEMFLAYRKTDRSGPVFWQIGTDGGYLDAPVKLRKLLLLPGERADVIVDFAGLPAGTKLLLRNTAKAPYPAGDAPEGNTTGRIMELRVVRKTGPDTSWDPATGGRLRRPMVRLVDPGSGTPAVAAQRIRQLTLNEVMGEPSTVDGIEYEGGPLEVLLNNTEMWGTDRPDFMPMTVGGKTMYVSELPHEGETEIWEIVNLTADAHPIHLHLVQFQVLNRQPFDRRDYEEAYAAAFPGGIFAPGYGPPLDYESGNPRALGGNPDVTPFLKRKLSPPELNEAGWKDTLVVMPDAVTRFVVRWAPTDLPAATPAAEASFPFAPDGEPGYVWHCHIIDHEDNEMMRPTSVLANPADRSYVAGVDY